MVTYDSAAIYINSATELRTKIERIESILTAMEELLVTAATTDNKKEYEFNDGQSKVRLVYNGVKGITDGIQGLETLKQRYINQLTGRKTRLVDSKNFR